MLLKIGSWIMVVAGVVLAGYLGYLGIRELIRTTEIGMLVKVVILVGAGGLLVTVVGLWFERRKEDG